MCPEFSSLYQLTLEELHEALVRKVAKLESEVEDDLSSLFDGDSGGQKMMKQLQRLQAEAWKYLEIGISQEASPRSSKAKTKSQFRTVKECYDNYFSLYDDIKKLQWFRLMLWNMEERYSGSLT